MDKVSLLNQIKTALEGLLIQTQKLEGEQSMHQIDKDLLLEKTRALYEQMMALENTRQKDKMSGQAPASEEEIPAVEELTETVVVEEEIVTETLTVEDREMPDAEPEKKVPEPEEKPEKEGIPVTEEKVVEPVIKEEPVEEKPDPVEKTDKPVEPLKTTLDLFSEAPPETLGEMLTSAEKPAVADSLQMRGINDLREAIGINDKFLFINELFNGDLGRYNKVIDELNGFSGLSGAQTYLTELQVQYQWAENSQAYQKLNVLLERKFT